MEKNQREREKLAPTFDDVVKRLKDEGIHSIRKLRFRLVSEEWAPDYYFGGTHSLDDPTELEEPDFWVPVGFDGYGWTVFLCVPPWLANDSRAANRYSVWKDGFDWVDSGELSEDSESFIHSMLSEMAVFEELVPRSSGSNTVPSKRSRTSRCPWSSRITSTTAPAALRANTSRSPSIARSRRSPRARASATCWSWPPTPRAERFRGGADRIQKPKKCCVSRSKSEAFGFS